MIRKIITSIFLLCLMLPVYSQNSQERVITGTVLESGSDEPLPGASVVVSGTRNGTYADANGSFSIKTDQKNPVLKVSYIGFVDMSVKVDGRNNLTVRLQPDSNLLDEMVVIGYAEKKKENLLGAVSTAVVDDADMRALASAELLLQGKMAGVMMTQTSAQPGSTSSEIRVRGITSIDNNNSPLVIIDGVESNMDAINPKDIESVTVLKDASSAAIYGARAAAGVIIITSKQGRRGMKINYSNSFSLQTPTHLPDVINDPVQYIDIANEAFLNSGLTKKYSDTARKEWEEGGTILRTPVDWKELIYRNGFMQDHFVNMSGAGERYDYAVSVGYMDQKGVVAFTKANQFTYKTKVNVHFWNKKLTLGANISGKILNSHEAQATSSLVHRYMQNRPILFFKSTEGGRNIYGASAAFYAIEELGGGNDKDYNELNMIYTAKVKPVKGLQFTVNYSRSQRKTAQTKYIPYYEQASNAEVTIGTFKRSELTKANNNYSRNLFNAVGQYNLSVKNHNIDILAGFETIETFNDNYSVHGYDLSKNEPIVDLLDPVTVTVDASKNEYAIMSFFGRLSYDYAGRYLVEMNFRRDGSSVFAKGYRYFNSPSVALAWRISEEPFMKGAGWLDNLKLRASYGILGNYLVSGNYYAFANKIVPQQNYTFGGVISSGYAYNLHANPYTTWESIRQANLGIDFEFLKEFSISAEYFDKRTTNMLSAIYQPLSLGVGSNRPAVNAGEMLNRGYELTIDYEHYFNNDFRISAGANIGFVRNTVVSLGGNKDQWHTSDGTVRSELGHPFMSLYGYRCIGLYQVDDFTWQNGSDPSIPHMERQYVLKPGRTETALHTNPRPGDLLLEDQDGDNIITPNDVVRLGNGRAETQFALSFGIRYKGFDFSMMAQGQGNANVYIQRAAPYSTAFTGQIFTNYINERWTEATPQYRCLYADKQRLDIISSYDVHNAAYLRLKNVQLSYTFSGGFLDRIKVQGLKLFISGENLLTWSSFPEGFDPERVASNSSVTVYPLIKSYTGGLILNF